MNAEIVSVGTEILLGQIVDTNAAELGTMLAELGISHLHRQTVGDNQERLAAAMRLALGRSDIVFTIGGLGPTQDDMTRDGVAAAIGEELITDREVEAKLRTLFESRRLPWVASNARQAQRPPSAEIIENPNGTAPGLVVRKEGKMVFCLPGPRGEFVPMALGPVRQILQALGGQGVIHSRTLRICGMGESMVEDKLRDLILGSNPTVAPYAKPAELHLRVTAKAPSLAEADAIIDPVHKEIAARLGDALYGTDETTLEQSVIELLRSRGNTLCVAESCTGGGLGNRLTSVSGSSTVFIGGGITYSNAMKSLLVGVSETTLEEHGAVSKECAEEMARGARERFGATYALSVTGIAGPGGGTAEKPVGLVYIGLSGPRGTTSFENRFRGSREDIRWRSTQMALVQLRKAILSER